MLMTSLAGKEKGKRGEEWIDAWFRESLAVVLFLQIRIMLVVTRRSSASRIGVKNSPHPPGASGAVKAGV
ncbi:hypothetical protein E2C01_086636 [Portunus trituberculatus]|uniref:Uncharacterized protein n=1 Tax=Portunus trituberculatus TaxID=210409 RepID=A0A5B7J4B1_PORTR|nr:hypothetical protein [Portunus trituberculatus]